MSNATQQLKAQQRRQKFADLLREMFQLNQPELDFGLYRIMHARKDDINRFIDQDLPRITQEAFSQYASQDQAQLEAELEEHIKSAKGLGVDPDAIPKVQELKQQLQGGFDLAREEGEVYDALVTFFNRYYNEGDFLSRRVYKDGTYAIPYQGEEVVLHWANKDQYYIKSSETLRDYSFRLNPDAGLGEDPMRVHFKLVDAGAGAKDNNKESADSRRVFVLDLDSPFELIEGEATEYGDQHAELQCRFVLRPATESDWTEAEKKKATAAAQKKPPTQDALRAIAEERLLGAASDLPEPWKSALAKPYRKADGNRADYSMLAGQLNNYTKKNTFDYFIHKDLAGFLIRELDFYIKNELLDWDDLASLKNDTARLAPLLSKIEVIRSLGEKIIAFLAQLENFQKKLWLKKKFVTETNYIVTLDYFERCPELLREVLDNKEQLNEWEEVYKVDLSELKDNRSFEELSESIFRSDYKYLSIDSSYFSESFKEKIISVIDDLDGSLNGVLLHSENFQAVNFIKERYSGKVRCTYIDPPYNTGKDGFPYKDSYQHSSWLSCVVDRSAIGNTLSSDDGVLWVSLDDAEAHYFKCALDGRKDRELFLMDFIWKKRDGAPNDRTIGSTHEHILCWGTTDSSEKSLNLMPRTEKADAQYQTFKEPDGPDPRGPFRKIDTTANGKGGRYVESLYYPIRNPYTNEDVWPRRGTCWRHSKSEMERLQKDNRLYWGVTGEAKTPMRKLFKFEARQGMATPSIWDDLGYNQHASNEMEKLFGSKAVFDTPKPTSLLQRIIRMSSDSSSNVLDYFAGSGTTGHAVIDLNREDGGDRKYILVEMGEYFDSVLKPRIKKAAYSRSWKLGAPSQGKSGSFSGMSHLVKCLRLESYEDTLGNLKVSRKQEQQHLLIENESKGTAAVRSAYLINYMLEVESRGSQSLININNFIDPTNYKLQVRSPSGDETKTVNVDLLETFNYLLGLTIEYIAERVHFEAELNQGEYGRWQAKVKRSESGKWWFRTVYGTNRAGQQVLVVWRNLPSVIDGEADGIQKDNAVLDAVLIEKLSIRLTESQDDEIDVLYVNGDHNISIPRSRKGEPMEQARIQLIEEAFHRLMFADTEAVH